MIKRQIVNLFWLRSISLGGFLSYLPKFGFCYLLGNGLATMPLNITIEPTRKCNLSCISCFVDKSSDQVELTLSQWKALLQETMKYCTSYYIAGGEPFLRQDIFGILELMGKSKVRFGLTTNGTLLDGSKVKRLMATGITYLIFSLDGEKFVHDSIRGQGTYEKTVKAIKLAVRHSKTTRVFINTVVLPHNYTQLFKLPKIAKSLNVFGISLQHCVYRVRFEWPGLVDSIAAFKWEAKKQKLRVFYKPFLDSVQVRSWYGDGFIKKRCLMPWSQIRINPGGGVLLLSIPK